MEEKSRLWVNNNEAVIWIVFALILIGTVNVFSSSFVKAGFEYNNPYYFLQRHLMYLVIGFAGMYVASKVYYKKWRKLVPFLLLFTIGALIAVALVGIEVNGSRRWVNIGVQFQPSELAKLVTILFMAAYLGPRMDRQAEISIFSKQMLVIGVMAAFVYRQPDMGTATIIFGLGLLLHFLGMPWRNTVVLLVILGGVAAVLTMSASYRLERILAWYDPWPYQQVQGYQTVQSLLAIGSGGFLGQGLGQGTSKFMYLPEAHTDFAFAILCQEMGYIGALLVLFLFAALAVYSCRIAKKIQDGFGKMLTAGIIALVVGQGVANMAMVTGILPVIGVPLPFISYGGTSLIINMVSIGILINVGKCVAKQKTPETGGGEKIPVPKEKPKFKLLRRGA